MSGGLAQAFRAAGGASAVSDAVELEARLSDILAAARRAWPALELPPGDFVAHLAARASEADALVPTPGALDLYLVAAHLKGLAAATAEIEGRARAQVRRAARRLRLSESDAEDLAQQTLAAAFVGEAGAPGLAAFSGRGPLDAWLAATAFRIGLRGKERAGREQPQAQADEALGWDQVDPELDFIKKRYRDDFSAAFRRALETLETREKNVLRLYLLGGMNIDGIGACYRVHRATVARWIAASREKLLAETRAELARALRLKASEVDSLVGLLESQVEISLANYLASSQG